MFGVFTWGEEHGAVDGNHPREVGCWTWGSCLAKKARLFGWIGRKERVWGIIIVSRVEWHKM